MIDANSKSQEEFEYLISTCFALPQPIADRCESYFLRRWNIEYFLDQMDWRPMSLNYEGTEYRLVFMDNLKWREEYTQVFLSFRKPANPVIPAYVLVKGYKESKGI